MIGMSFTAACLLLIAPAMASSIEEEHSPPFEFFNGTAEDLMPESDRFDQLELGQDLNWSGSHDFDLERRPLLKISELESPADLVLTRDQTLISDQETPTMITQELLEPEADNLVEEVLPSIDNADPDAEWNFKIQPYYTIPWKVYGSATADGITVDLDIGLDSLIDLLQAYANTRFEAWRGNLGIIVDFSYWSFRGVNNFQQGLQLNSKIRQQIQNDIDFFIEQEIDNVRRLLAREQDFFQALVSQENTLVRQLIDQEIETFRQALLNQMGRVGRQDFMLSSQLNQQQIQASQRLRDSVGLLQELERLNEQLSNQAIALNPEPIEAMLPEKEKIKLEAIKKTIEKLEQKRQQTESILPFDLVQENRRDKNNQQYTLGIRDELDQLEQKLAQAINDIQALEQLRQQILDDILGLEIDLFRQLLTTEIDLFERFNQRIGSDLRRIYERTLQALQDLQQFEDILNSAQSNPENLGLVGDLSLDYDQGTYDFALSYHFGEQPMAYDPDVPAAGAFPLVWFEPIAGVRLNDLYLGIEADISYDFEGEFTNIQGGFTESFTHKRTWFELMFGGKLGMQISPPITLWLRGDASGLGLSGETNLTWNLIAGMDWWVSPSTSLLLGYHFYEFNNRNGSGENETGLDINFNGPLLGITYQF